LKILKIISAILLLISLSGCNQERIDVSILDYSFKTERKGDEVYVSYSVQIENSGEDTYHILIPNLSQEIESFSSVKQLIVEIPTNSTVSTGSNFTVDITTMEEPEIEEILDGKIIKGFYIGKYIELK
jgi:hypothetical protein